MRLKNYHIVVTAIHLILLLYCMLLWMFAKNSVNIEPLLCTISTILTLTFSAKLINWHYNSNHPSMLSVVLSGYLICGGLLVLLEPEVLNWLASVLIIIFIIEVSLYARSYVLNSFHYSLISLCVIFVATVSIYPEIGVGYVILSDDMVALLKAQLLFMWGVALLIVILQLQWNNNLKIKKQSAEDYGVWYSDLFSILSHNIRTPLASIYNVTQIMQLKDQQGQSLELSRDNLRVLKESSGLALEVVDEILRRDAQIKVNGPLENLRVFLEDYQNNFPEISFEQKPWMNTCQLTSKDQLALSLSLDVIIGNSKRFKASQINIYSPREFILCIQDNGPGMSDEVRHYYGKPYNPYRSKESSGLGSFFALEILRKSGWELTAPSSANGAIIQLRKRVY